MEDRYAIKGFAVGLQDLQLADHQNAMLVKDVLTKSLNSKTDEKSVAVQKNAFRNAVEK